MSGDQAAVFAEVLDEHAHVSVVCVPQGWFVQCTCGHRFEQLEGFDTTRLLEADFVKHRAHVAAALAAVSDTAPIVRGWRAYKDGSRSPVERWVKAADGDWISLDSTRRTSGDILTTDAGVNAGPDVATALPGSDGADEAPDEAKPGIGDPAAPASAYPHDDARCRQDSVDAEGFREACRQFGRLAEAAGLPDAGLGLVEAADLLVGRLAVSDTAPTEPELSKVLEHILLERMDGEFLVGAGRGVSNEGKDVGLSEARPSEVALWAARIVLDHAAPTADRATKAEALEEAADAFESDMSSAWGGDAAWLTTGDKVARLVADCLREDAAALRAGEGE